MRQFEKPLVSQRRICPFTHLKTIPSSPLLTLSPGLRGLPLPPDGLELQSWTGSGPRLCSPCCYSSRSGDPHFDLTLVDLAINTAFVEINVKSSDSILCRCFGGQYTSWGLSLHLLLYLEKTINVIHTSLKLLRPNTNKETNKTIPLKKSDSKIHICIFIQR